MKKGISEKVIQRIEALEGRPVCEALTELYIGQVLTYRMLCQRWAIQPQQLIKLVKHCGIEPRKGGEAIRVQWLGNTERRAAQAEAMGIRARELAATGRHGRLGVNKETSEAVRERALKQRETTSFRDPVVREAIRSKRVSMYRADPSSHPNAKAIPSKCEQLMLEHFRQLGYSPQFSYHLSPYWVDVFLPELGIGIECVNKKRPTWARHAHIAGQGAHMLYVTNEFIDAADFRQLDDYIAGFQVLSTNPAFKREEAMIWGSKYVFFFTDQPNNALIEVIKMDELHCLRFSAPANY